MDVMRLYLAVRTRDEDTAATSDDLLLYLDDTEVARFAVSHLPRGKTVILERDVCIDYWDFDHARIELALDGDDRWGPGSVFLWGMVPGNAYSCYEPLACKFSPIYHITGYLSQDSDEGTDRMRLLNLGHMHPNCMINDFLLIIDNGNPQQARLRNLLDTDISVMSESAVIEHVREYFADSSIEPDSPGTEYVPDTPSEVARMELSVHAKFPNFTDNPDPDSVYGNMRGLVFQTEVNRIGKQVPQSGVYFGYFSSSPYYCEAGLVTQSILRMKTDIVWKPERVFLFGIAYDKA